MVFPTRVGVNRRPEGTYSTRVYYTGESERGERVELAMVGINLVALPSKEGLLAVINHAGRLGFSVCSACGYSTVGGEKLSTPHKTPWRSDCRARVVRYDLGHEFGTDVLQLRVEGYADGRRGFWLSLLYSLLESVSAEMDIDKADIDGSLYPYGWDRSQLAIVLFDGVPGGAGHVRRVARDHTTLQNVLTTTKNRLAKCECGGEEGNTSCYGCLRNNRNQFCHEELRGPVVRCLRKLGVQECDCVRAR